jgi:Ethanolamine utilization protein EutJ (predicted chaperonin)
VTTPHQPGFAIGIDLGTSNTVAVVRTPDGRTRPLLFDGQPILPSTVFVDESGHLHVGRDAQRMAQLDPARCEPNPKRRIDEQTVLLGDRELPVVTLLAALLKQIAAKAVEAVGFLPPAALTHPAAWGPTRRGVLLEAVRQAGWPPVTLVPEPIAAARYFAEVMRRPVPVGSALAVFDFGGGTLDVAIVRNAGTGFEVVGTGGDERLGGLDLDEALVRHIGGQIGQRYPQIWQHLCEPTSTTDRRHRRLFWADVGGAKEMLSRSTNAPVPVPGVEAAIHLTRDELERLTAPLLDRAVAATGATIGQAGLRPDQLSGLFLVGGSSRVPMVARLLHAKLGIAPSVLEQPELPVAEGALAELVPADAATEPIGYPMSAMPVSPAAGVPVSALPGQSGPVSGGPGQAGSTSGGPIAPGAPVLEGAAPWPHPPAGPPPGGPAGHSQAPFGNHQGPPAPPAGRPAWYRRPKIIVPAAAAVVLLLVLGGYLLLRNPYQERDFDSLKAVGSVTYEHAGDKTWVEVVGDTAYTMEIDSGDSYTSSGTAIVQAIPLRDKTGKATWTKRFDSGGADWDTDWGMQVYDGGGIAIRYRSDGDTPGRYYLISLDDGSSWHSDAADDDAFGVAVGAGVVLRQTGDGSRTTALRLSDGGQAWHHAGVAYVENTPDDLARPARFGSSWPMHGAEKGTRAVFVDTDNVATLVDLRTGHELAGGDSQRLSGGTATARPTRLVYHGWLLDMTSTAGFQIRAYSLDTMKQKWVHHGSGYTPDWIQPCGESLLCIKEHRGDATDGSAEKGVRLVALDLGDGTKEAWHKDVKGLDGVIGVGDRVVVTAHDGKATTTVYDDGGALQDRLPGTDAARIDDASMLLANGVVGSNETDPNWTMTGYGVQSGNTDTLGPLAADLSRCEFSDTYLACSGDGKFEFWRFRS